MSNSVSNAKTLTLTSTKSLMNTGTLSCRILRMKTWRKFRPLRISITLIWSKIAPILSKSCLRLSSNQLNCWTCARFRKTSLSKRTTRMPIRCSNGPRCWKKKSAISLVSTATRRFLRQKPTWCKNSKMKWTRSRRSLRAAWTNFSSCVKLNTTKFCSAIKTWRKRLKTNRSSNALRKSAPTSPGPRPQIVDPRWWTPARCSRPRWARARSASAESASAFNNKKRYLWLSDPLKVLIN